MNILISNDDGIESPGLHFLASALETLGQVTVVAPHRERSTSGHSLTLHKPLRCKEVAPNRFAVSGTPADCVYMATRLLMKSKPDVIVSGINRGANLGNDVYYSGTVAAAREGAYYGVNAVAVSLCFNEHGQATDPHWDSAAHFAKIIVEKILHHNEPVKRLINVNVPNLPLKKIRGIRLAKQGLRYYSDLVTTEIDPRKKPYYWLGGEYKGFEKIPGSDCVIVDGGYVAVTPLKLDSTDYEIMEEFKKWETDISG